MDFSLSPEQQQIRDEVRKLCVKFDDAYWLEKDRSGDFPHATFRTSFMPRSPRPAGSALRCPKPTGEPVSASPKP